MSRLRACKRFFPYAILLVAAPLLLSGCTSVALNGLNGAGACPADAVRTASINYYVLSNLPVNPTVDDLAAAEPAERDRLTLRDGRTVELWSYRTGHPRCRNMPTEEEFIPVVIDTSSGEVLGVGSQLGRQFRNMAVARADLTPDPTSGTSYTDILMGRF